MQMHASVRQSRYVCLSLCKIVSLCVESHQAEDMSYRHIGRNTIETPVTSSHFVPLLFAHQKEYLFWLMAEVRLLSFPATLLQPPSQQRTREGSQLMTCWKC